MPVVRAEDAVVVAGVAAGRFAMKPVGSGAWMLERAWEIAFLAYAGRNEMVVGAGMTIPIPAARRSIR